MIRDILHAKAREMADHDGVPVGVLHIHGAANHLIAEILRERDDPTHRPRGPKYSVGQRVRQGLIVEVNGNDIVVESADGNGPVRTSYPAENLNPLGEKK